MLTVAPITMMIHAEEQAKHQEQTLRMRAEEMQRSIPSEMPTSRWLAAIGNFAASLRRKAQYQPTVTTCCVEGRSCAHA